MGINPELKAEHQASRSASLTMATCGRRNHGKTIAAKSGKHYARVEAWVAGSEMSTIGHHRKARIIWSGYMFDVVYRQPWIGHGRSSDVAKIMLREYHALDLPALV
ncbi:hypothetical protein WG66_009971 [Moniliophthora roreri]|nr:hypothetical protein WG66_009971 [Moniliophthora roreri]